MDSTILNNGLVIPMIGMGTWQINDRERMNTLIRYGTELGYKLIDTAAAYGNEISIAKAIESSGVKRESILISDKVWNTSRGYNEVQDACKRSLKKLKTDYIDLYLIHWPASMKLYSDWEEINAETWAGMEKLYKDGIVKSIGVCNFKIHHLEELKKTAVVMPMIDQVEFHPGMYPIELLDYCNQNDIKMMASSPLGNGKILNNEMLVSLAKRRGRTVSQICLRWALQKGVIVIPKTATEDRLSENIALFDFDLSDEEMKIVDDIQYCGGLRIDSDEVIEFG